MTKILLLLVMMAPPADRADADRLFDAGSWAEARAAYESLLESVSADTEQADVLDRIGSTYLFEGDSWKAETWFSKSLEIQETARTRLHRGQAYYYAGRRAASDPLAFGAEVTSLMNDAARELLRSLEMDPGQTDAWLALGYVQGYRGEPEAGEESFRKALELEPGNPEALFRVALAEERKGRLDRALGLLSRIPEGSRTVDHWMAVGRVDGRIGDREASAAAWRRAVMLAPGNRDAYLGLWRETGLKKYFVEFNQDMDAVRTRHPDVWLPDYYLGFSYEYDGKADEAVQAFRRAYEKNPEEIRCLVCAGDVLLKQDGRESEATDLFLTILDRDPGNQRAIEVVTVKAGSKLVARDFDAAAKLFGALREADPGDWSHTTNLAIVMREAGKIDRAVELYREASERFPFEPQIPNDLGLLLMGVGRREEAYAAFAEALDRDPEFLDSLENMGSFARLEGRLEEARSYYHRAYDRVRALGEDASKFRRLLDMTAREIEE